MRCSVYCTLWETAGVRCFSVAPLRHGCFVNSAYAFADAFRFNVLRICDFKLTNGINVSFDSVFRSFMSHITQVHCRNNDWLFENGID